MNTKGINYIYPLNKAENSLLQVLLSGFTIERSGENSTLTIQLKSNLPTIRRRENKLQVKKLVKGFKIKAKQIQGALDDVLIDQTSTKFILKNNDDFLFRYSNGGTLPIIRYKKKEYYCLFYRDVFPIGWNIANGASDSIAELLDPETIIKRELREELMIFNFMDKIDYYCCGDIKPGLYLPEYQLARKLLRELRPHDELDRFKVKKLTLTWISGPDSININFENNKSLIFSGYFLNINALDLGIELDKIGKIAISDDTVLVDGEIINNTLLNRPIGLFEVEKTNKAIITGSKKFIPDIGFYSGLPFNGSGFEKICVQFMKRLVAEQIRKKTEVDRCASETLKYDLCPVARSIIKRYMRCEEVNFPVPQKPYDIFISYSHKDEAFAQRLYTSLKAKNIKSWIAPRNLSIGAPLRVDIHNAIKHAGKVLVILSENSLKSQWVESEIEAALAYESHKKNVNDNTGGIILPVKIDNSIDTVDTGWAFHIRNTRHIMDFQGRMSGKNLDAAVEKLIAGM